MSEFTHVHLLRENDRWLVRFIGDDMMSVAIRKHFETDTLRLPRGVEEREARTLLRHFGVSVVEVVAR